VNQRPIKHRDLNNLRFQKRKGKAAVFGGCFFLGEKGSGLQEVRKGQLRRTREGAAVEGKK